MTPGHIVAPRLVLMVLHIESHTMMRVAQMIEGRRPGDYLWLLEYAYPWKSPQFAWWIEAQGAPAAVRQLP